MFPRIIVPLSVFALMALTSCEDKEMVAKNQEQARRIEALRAELAVHKVKLDANWERDPSADLEEIEYATGELKGKVSDLERELKQIKKDKERAEESFNDYKKKYPVGL